MAKEQIKRFISSSSCIVQKGGSSSSSHSSSSASSSSGDSENSSSNNNRGAGFSQEAGTLKTTKKANLRKLSLKQKLLKAFTSKQALADATNPQVALSIVEALRNQKSSCSLKTPKRIDTLLESKFNGKENTNVEAVCCIYQATPAG